MISIHPPEATQQNLLKRMRSVQELCDVAFVVGDERVLAHSCVLATQSSIIMEILKYRLENKSDWSVIMPLYIALDNIIEESFQPLPENNTSKRIIELLISLIYGESIYLSKVELESVIWYAKLLCISEELCNILTTALENSKLCDSIVKNINENQQNVESVTNIVLFQNIDIEDNINMETNDKSQLSNMNAIPKIVPETNASDIAELSDKSHNITELHNKYANNIEELPPKCGNEIEELKNQYSNCITVLPNKNPDNITELPIKYCDNIEELPNKMTPDEIMKSEYPTDNIEKMCDEPINNPESPIAPVVKCEHTDSQKLVKKTTKQSSKSIGCKVCKLTFFKCNDLVQHVIKRKHYSEICPVCFIQINDIDSRELHFSQHDHALPYFCAHCELRYRTRAALTMHTPKHSNSKPFNCEECGRSFKWRHSLQAHTLTHKNQFHLLCEICGFSSNYGNSFKAHLQQHAGKEMPFQCPQSGCNFKSYRKTHLKDHLISHSKVRPHQCEVCGRSFSQAKNMRRHMKLHTSDILLCSDLSNLICDFRTTRLDKLKHHLAKKHNLDSQGFKIPNSDKKSFIENLEKPQIDHSFSNPDLNNDSTILPVPEVAPSSFTESFISELIEDSLNMGHNQRGSCSNLLQSLPLNNDISKDITFTIDTNEDLRLDNTLNLVGYYKKEFDPELSESQNLSTL